MSRRKITRREALGSIGKTGLGLSMAPAFFLSLNTESWPGGRRKTASTETQVKPARKPVPDRTGSEKAVIIGNGSKLTVRISGPAGRHCAVAFAVSDVRQSYKPVRSGRGVIGKNGTCEIEIETKNLPDAKVFLRVLTGSSRDFNKDTRGTQAFEVEISKGRIARFAGVRARALDEATAAASTAAACYATKGA